MPCGRLDTAAVPCQPTASQPTRARPTAVSRLIEGEGVDRLIDSVGQASGADSLRSLRRGDRLVTCGATTGGNPSAEIQRLFIRQLEVCGCTGGSIEDFRQLMALFARGEIRSLIGLPTPIVR